MFIYSASSPFLSVCLCLAVSFSLTCSWFVCEMLHLGTGLWRVNVYCVPSMSLWWCGHRRRKMCEDAGECQDEARKDQGQLVLAGNWCRWRWYCRWRLAVPFWGTWGWQLFSAALCRGKLSSYSDFTQMFPYFPDVHNYIWGVSWDMGPKDTQGGWGLHVILGKGKERQRTRISKEKCAVHRLITRGKQILAGDPEQCGTEGNLGNRFSSCLSHLIYIG